MELHPIKSSTSADLRGEPVKESDGVEEEKPVPVAKDGREC